MADIERQYAYRPKWWAILFLGGFFALAAVLFAYKIAHPWPENLPVLCWIAFVASLLGLALPGAAAVQRLSFRRRVALTPTSLLLPKCGWSSAEQAIAYQAITGLNVSKSRGPGPRYLYVSHREGRRRIAEASLPSRAAFEEICELLTARVRACEHVGAAELHYRPIRMNEDDDSGRVVTNDSGASAEYVLDPCHAAA
jgi:hypothetical protein